MSLLAELLLGEIVSILGRQKTIEAVSYYFKLSQLRVSIESEQKISRGEIATYHRWFVNAFLINPQL